MTPWSPPSYDVKIIGGRKVHGGCWWWFRLTMQLLWEKNWQVIIWDEPQKEKKKPVFVPAIIRYTLNVSKPWNFYFFIEYILTGSTYCVFCFSSASLKTHDQGKLITKISCDYPVNVSNSSSSKFAHFRRCDMIGRPRNSISQLLSPVLKLKPSLALQVKDHDSVWFSGSSWAASHLTENSRRGWRGRWRIRTGILKSIWIRWSSSLIPFVPQ